MVWIRCLHRSETWHVVAGIQHSMGFMQIHCGVDRTPVCRVRTWIAQEPPLSDLTAAAGELSRNLSMQTTMQIEHGTSVASFPLCRNCASAAGRSCVLQSTGYLHIWKARVSLESASSCSVLPSSSREHTLYDRSAETSSICYCVPCSSVGLVLLSHQGTASSCARRCTQLEPAGAYSL